LDGIALCKDNDYPKLYPLPMSLNHYVTNGHVDFRRKSSYYNNMFALLSIGVDNGRKGVAFEKIIGDSAVKLNGRTYHYFQNSGNRNCGINYVTFDAVNELTKYGNEFNNKISKDNKNDQQQNNESLSHVIFEKKVLESLFYELRGINDFMEDLKLIGKNIININGNNNNCNLNPIIPETLKMRINEKTHYLEIGAVISDLSDGNIVFKYKVKDQYKTILSNSGLVEPLAFPLLHPFGELGYDSYKNKKYSFLRYMVNRWLMPEETYYSYYDEMEGTFDESSVYCCNNKNMNNQYVLMSMNKLKTAIIPTNRFQTMSRLAQYHLVDGLSRSIDFKLKWHDKNKALIFGNREKTYDDYYVENNNNEMLCNNIVELESQKDLTKKQNREEYSNSNPSFLAGSFHGGPRHLKQLATSALVIVTELGDPTIFLTATCNPLWIEIQEMLLPGQSAFDRPDITDRIFKKKLGKLLINLRNGQYFGNSKIIYELRVIEYQHRGLPHAHLVFKLSDTPNRNNDEECYDWINHWISAELPDPIENNELYCKVSNHMLHKCSKGVNGCLDKNGICGKG
jgi:hypothetical protein